MTNPIDIVSNNINKLRILQQKDRFDREQSGRRREEDSSIDMLTPVDTSSSYITKEITEYILTDEIEASNNSFSPNDSFFPSLSMGREELSSTNHYPSSQLKINALNNSHNSHNSSFFMHNNLSYCQQHQFLNNYNRSNLTSTSLPNNNHLAMTIPSINRTILMTEGKGIMMTDDESSINGSMLTGHDIKNQYNINLSTRPINNNSASSLVMGGGGGGTRNSIPNSMSSSPGITTAIPSIPTTTQSLEQLLEKQRKRKENHNAVERRRRDHINEMIQKLSSVIEATMFSEGEGAIISNLSLSSSCSSCSFSSNFNFNTGSLHETTVASLQGMNNNGGINGINSINSMNNNVNIVTEDSIRLNKGEVLERSIKLIMNMRKVIRLLMTLKGIRIGNNNRIDADREKSIGNGIDYQHLDLSKYEDVLNFLSHESFIIQDK